MKLQRPREGIRSEKDYDDLDAEEVTRVAFEREGVMTTAIALANARRCSGANRKRWTPSKNDDVVDEERNEVHDAKRAKGADEERSPQSLADVVNLLKEFMNDRDREREREREEARERERATQREREIEESLNLKTFMNNLMKEVASRGPLPRPVDALSLTEETHVPLGTACPSVKQPTSETVSFSAGHTNQLPASQLLGKVTKAEGVSWHCVDVAVSSTEARFKAERHEGFRWIRQKSGGRRTWYSCKSHVQCPCAIKAHEHHGRWIVSVTGNHAHEPATESGSGGTVGESPSNCVRPSHNNLIGKRRGLARVFKDKIRTAYEQGKSARDIERQLKVDAGGNDMCTPTASQVQVLLR